MFQFKRFAIDDTGCGMKLSTDSVLLGAWADVDGASHILDLGCGSGILSLMCAQRNELASITAIDYDNGACSAATANTKQSPWANRIRVEQANAFEYKCAEAPDLIICNPPYFVNGMISPDSARAKARHGETIADVAQIALTPFSAIDLATQWLSPCGSIAMITPYDYYSALLYHAEMKRLKLRRLCRVHTAEHKPATRLLWQLCRIDGPAQETSIIINSPEYHHLTQDFYL